MAEKNVEPTKIRGIYEYELNSIMDCEFDCLLWGLKDPECSIKTLTTDGFYLTQKQIEDLFEALKTNTTITKLSAHFSTLNVDCRKIGFSTTLKSLSISSWENVVNCDALVSWINTLGTLKKLTIASSVTKAELHAFKNLNCKLRSLELTANTIAAEGMTSWVEFLKSNKYLGYFRLCGRRISKRGYWKELESMIADLLEVNQNFIEFEISFREGMVFNKKDQQWIKECLQRNEISLNEMHQKLVLLSHNIARSKTTLELLPKEIWLLIFERLDTVYDYRDLLKQLFVKYNR